jgi:exodeoxyribonuclease VII large subunit
VAILSILELKYIFERMESDNITITTKTYSLQELMLSVQSILLKTYSNRLFWVRCEISRISPHTQSGHCYLELTDKNETSIVAQQRGIIWADRYLSICEKFQAVTNTLLAGGMKVLLQCSVSFHPVHGLSLIISDIEPSFTLGEMARMKNESIKQLKSTGFFDLNKQKNLAILPQRIAIVSVETSRGYLDFVSTIKNHSIRFNIKCRLFTAILQGENAVPTLTNALEQIYSEKEKFDAIAIIRGGAGDAGLSCYDDFSLSALIADSPLPVITGIGHATNETVVEMVAYKNCITPTAAATFILQKFDDQFLFLKNQTEHIRQLIKEYFVNEKQITSILAERFCLIVKNNINRRSYEYRSLIMGLPAYLSSVFSLSKQNINQIKQSILNVKKLSNHSELLTDINRKINEINRKAADFFNLQKKDLTDRNIQLKESIEQLKKSNETIVHLADKITLLDPVNILKRGYSITRINGKAILESGKVKSGNKIETQLADGILISTVESKK